MLQEIKNLIRKYTPAPLVQARKNFLFKKEMKQFQNKSNQEIFSTVYAEKLWGEDKSLKFYSGEGTHNETTVTPYIAAVTGYLDSLPSKPNVVDLGCGDFTVGKIIVEHCETYLACDVVEELIQSHRKTFADTKVEFQQVDIAYDDLPKGDIVFLRQVLQHLSNEHIANVVRKIEKNYSFLILTEHLPDGNEWTPNLDIVSGPHTRFSRDSGVILDDNPFNLNYLRKSPLLEIKDEFGVLRTDLYQLR